MAHLNRRADDPDDGRSHRVLDTVESTWAKFFSRLLLPVLLAIIGFFLVRTLNEVVANQEAQQHKQDEQGKDIMQMKSDIRVIGTRLDENVIRQIGDNGKQIDDHEKRINALERKVQP